MRTRERTTGFYQLVYFNVTRHLALGNGEQVLEPSDDVWSLTPKKACPAGSAGKSRPHNAWKSERTPFLTIICRLGVGEPFT